MIYMENAMNLPNKITIARICFIPIFVLLFYLDVLPNHIFIATLFFILIAFTDFLDGYIARKYNLVTNLGKFLDPIADKVLISTAYILILTKADILKVLWVDNLVVIFSGIAIAFIMARELIVSGFRMVAASANIVLPADKIGKIKTVFQIISVLFLLLSGDFFGVQFACQIFSGIGLITLAIATVLTVISGLHYIIKNKEVFKDA